MKCGSVRRFAKASKRRSGRVTFLNRELRTALAELFEERAGAARYINHWWLTEGRTDVGRSCGTEHHQRYIEADVEAQRKVVDLI